MKDAAENKASLKEKLFQGLAEYWINVIYLSLVFGAFTEYRRLVLAAHEIVYTNYWVAVIEALVLAKVIMIGDVVRLGRGLEDKALIYPTLYKTALFTVFVGLFKIVEFTIRSLLAGGGLASGLVALSEKGLHLVLAYSLVVFVALLPYFGVRELGKALGGARIRSLFFRSRAANG